MKLEDKVLAVLRANIERQKPLSLESDLQKDICLDSFGVLMVVNGLEEAFGIAIEDRDFSRVKTVADIVALLRSKLSCEHAELAA